MMRRAVSERLAHWKSILAMPKLVWLINASYAVLGAVTWGRDELIKHSPNDPVWHVVDFLPHWTMWQWGVGAALIVLASVLETSFQRKEEADTVHAADVKKLGDEIARQSGEIESLEAQLEQGPIIILSNVAHGINLRVECLRQDAINVRLAEVQTENYLLNSDVVRLLRAGTSSDLPLHCHPQRVKTSLVLVGYFVANTVL
jgi:hypothetical protein